MLQCYVTNNLGQNELQHFHQMLFLQILSKKSKN